MKIKTFFLIVCALALFFTGCEKNEFFTDSADNAALKSSEIKWVPIEAHDAYVVVTDFLDDVPVPGNQFPAAGICYGNMTHLGKLQAEKSIWYTTNLEPDTENPGFLLWSQTGDWCAANGDLLHWTIVTSVEMGAGKVSGRAEFDGGTGRFKNAKGYIDLKGHVDPDHPTSQFIIDEGVGMISNLKNEKLARDYVPFKGDFKIWIESFVEDGPNRTQIMVGTGNLTHLGKTDFYADENVSMESWTGEEEVTFTAANGDKLKANLTNVIDASEFPLLIIEGTGSFTGGTGRFENAEGNLNYHATFNVDENKGEKFFTGEIKW
jgi:hypothetical protein